MLVHLLACDGPQALECQLQLRSHIVKSMCLMMPCSVSHMHVMTGLVLSLALQLLHQLVLVTFEAFYCHTWTFRIFD